MAARLADQGIGVTVVDPRWVKPWDPAVVDMARDHRLVVCVEDNGRVGGCGSTLLQLLNDEQVETPFRQHGIPQEFLDHAKRDAILERIGLTAQALARGIVEDVTALDRGADGPGRDRSPVTPVETRSTAVAAGLTEPLPTARLRLAAIAAVLALLLGLVGCGGDDGETTARSVGDDTGVSAAQARPQEQRILNQRARAVREHDLDLFLRRVDHTDEALMARQRRYFRNLVQLPLGRFGYRVTGGVGGAAHAQRWGDDVHIPQVRLAMQLQDYDAVPVQRVVGFVFSFRKGRARIVSDRTATGKRCSAGTPAPWDLTRDQRARGAGRTRRLRPRDQDSADDRDVRGARRHRRDQPRTAVRLVRTASSSTACGTRGCSRRSATCPGGAIEHLGAMTFPTYAEGGGPQVASTRMLLMPSSVDAGQPFLGRITRHELSHVAVGVRDDGAPAWVSEGLAEYLGAREVPVRDRIIPTSALTAHRPRSTAMPASKDFNDTDQEWHYALSWMACDYIAETLGEARLWELVDAMHNGGEGTSDAEQDRVLVQVLGYDGDELARRAAARIRNIYG